MSTMAYSSGMSTVFQLCFIKKDVLMFFLQHMEPMRIFSNTHIHACRNEAVLLTLRAKVESELLGISVPMTGTTNLMIHSVLEEKSIVSNHLAV